MDAYITALTLLSRRELSTRQVRDRLERRSFSTADIDAAINRLSADRTLDDRRVAIAAARSAVAIKGHGRRRVLQRLQQLGVGAEITSSVMHDLFSETDEAALLERALERRLRGRAIDALDASGRAKLVRHLVSRGFDLSDVLNRLRRGGAGNEESDG